MRASFSRRFPARPNHPILATAAVGLLVCASVVTTAGLAQAASTASVEAPAQTAAIAPAAPTDPAVMEQHATADFAAEASALPSALIESLERDLGITAAEYLAEAAAATDAVEVVESLAAQGVQVDGSRLEGTQLVVNVDSPEEAAAVEAAGAVAETQPAETLDVTTVEFIPAFDVSGGDGYTWSTATKGNSQCSIGLTGYRVSDGRPMALTAGHCVAGMANISGSIKQLVQSAPGASGSIGQPIGTPGESRFGGGFDGGLITVDGAQAVQTPTVLTWGGGAGAPRSSAPLAVTDQSAAIVGANLCKSGSRTGWTCGTVKAVDRTVDVGGNQVNSILASTCIQPGDSGGTALMGTTVVGINSSTSSVACGDSAYVSAFFPMISAAGRASVATQFGSVWEPAFTVSTPKIDTVAISTSGAATSISGSVPQASGVVAVYFDGATSPATTARVQSGRWTVDAATLASVVEPGTHRVVAVMQQGKWSKSTGSVDATVVVAGSPKQVTGTLLPADVVTR